MLPENAEEKLRDTMKVVAQIGPDMVSIFNRSPDKSAVLIAIGGILGSSARSEEELDRAISLLTTAACAEYSMKAAAAERRKNADA